jgi:Rrf2 family cysteine metabolism transcriptional repressor
MKLDTRSRYGLRALLDLGLHYGQGPVTIREIARRQEISQSYLEQIIMSLKAAGLVSSVRGAHGGIELARVPAQIRLTEAMGALGGLATLVDCIDRPEGCSRSSFCVMRDIWTEMRSAMSGVLDNRTLEDIVEMQKRKDVSGSVTYNI